jgi:hypothetical protein
MEDYLIILLLTTHPLFYSNCTEIKRMQRSKLSPEQKKAEKDKNRLYKKKCRQDESAEKAATRKSNDKPSKKRKRQSKSADVTLTKKSTRVH